MLSAFGLIGKMLKSLRQISPGLLANCATMAAQKDTNAWRRDGRSGQDNRGRLRAGGRDHFQGQSQNGTWGRADCGTRISQSTLRSWAAHRDQSRTDNFHLGKLRGSRIPQRRVVYSTKTSK